MKRSINRLKAEMPMHHSGKQSNGGVSAVTLIIEAEKEAQRPVIEAN